MTEETQGIPIYPRGQKPKNIPLYRTPSDEEIASQMAGHDEGEKAYTLVADKFTPHRGGPLYRRGDVVSLSISEATRLLAARAVAPLDSPEARRARLQAAERAGDESARRQLVNEEIEARIEELRAQQERLHQKLEEGE
jgi:hypothetical protein